MLHITEDMSRTRNLSKNNKKVRQSRLLRRYRAKRFQRGVEVPKPGEQEHVLIVRIDLAPGKGKNKRKEVIDGLHKLCGLFSRLESGTKMLDRLNKKGLLESKKISDYVEKINESHVNFSFTIGFGIGFFDKLGIIRNRPRKLKSMPDHKGLGDVTPYSLAQTDMIIQIGSNSDFINRWVYENVLEPGAVKSESKRKKEDLPEDIVSAVEGWAIITDVHSGFQRIDGRNLMGFNDGVSNPNPGSGKKFDNVVWTTGADERPELRDGTYMVFQKISHDLDQWRELTVEEQEEWVGRDKVMRPDGGELRCDPELTAALVAGARRLGLEPYRGPLLTSRTFVVGDDRGRLAARGALAVDMEAGLLTADRVAVVRVVLDSPLRDLAPAWRRPATALLHPSAWSQLPWLAREGPRCARLAADVLAASLRDPRPGAA